MKLWQLLAVIATVFQQHSTGYLHVSPFFFLCNYHGNVQELGVNRGEVAVSVSVAGNPEHYTPGQFYEVTVTSSLNFDGFLLTGLYTISNEAMPGLLGRGLLGRQPMGQNLMCSIVHSHLSRRPLHELSFMWMAPPENTGCVSFLATASLGQQLLFKDTTVFQMCEKGAATLAPLRPALAEIHSNAVILRDDFDSNPDFRYDLWQTHDGGIISDKCGPVLFGNSALFCDKHAIRELTSAPLNTTSARVVQFSLSAGSCGRADSQDKDIIISYGINGCYDWFEIERIRPPTGRETETHLLNLPPEARTEGVCLRWKQTPYPVNIPPVYERTSTTVPTTTYRSKTTFDDQTTTPVQISTAEEYSSTPQKNEVTPEKIAATPVENLTSPGNEVEDSTLTVNTAIPASSAVSDRPFTSPSNPTMPASTSSAATPALSSTGKTMPGETDTPSTPVTPTSASYPEITAYFEFREAQDEPVRFARKGRVKNQQPGAPYQGDTSRRLFQNTQQDDPSRDLRENVYKRSARDRDERSISFKSCWGIDNIVIVNVADPPKILEESFDPIDPSNWLFFPGGNIRQNCHSDSNTMFFNTKNQTHNYVVTRDLDLSADDPGVDAVLHQEFESKVLTSWQVTGGHVGINCGVIHAGKSLVFESPETRQACTEYIDTTVTGNLRFYFGIGVGGCDSSESPKTSVQVYLEDREGNTFLLNKLQPERYREPQLVSIPITPPKTNSEARICWLQKYNTGAFRDVWALDDVTVLPHVPEDSDEVVQFGLNLYCGNDVHPNSVEVDYSTDHGETWTMLHQQCLPSACGGHYQPVSSVFSSQDFTGWNRITLPLPYPAQVPYVRFRWRQTGEDDSPNWAIDDVFIGHCSEGCNGHGTCQQDQCRCDFGHHGPTCRDPVVPNPMSVVESFEDPTITLSSAVLNIHGGSIGYDCGVVSTGKSLVFQGSGPRDITTTDFNTTDAQYLQYSVRVGSLSSASRCPPPDEESESVLLEYSCNGGVTWNFLREFSLTYYRTPRGDSVLLPTGAQDTSCRFRWRQPFHSGEGKDVWAIDELSLTKDLPNTLMIEAVDLKDMNEELTANLGKLIDSYCGAPKSITFSGIDQNGEPRFLMTEAMQIGPSYMIQFDLVMGCRMTYTPNINNKLYLEYSVDHGISWSLVEDPCLPPSVCDEYHSGTIYDSSQFQDWSRITVLLPPDTWSPTTRFRWQQPEWESPDTWAIKRIYIGQQCPFMCHGHGKCEGGVCKCDPGFIGDSCEPEENMDTDMHADFGMRYQPDDDFRHITGGDVVRSNEGCGPILSGESVYFFKDGVRELQTKDFDTSTADFLDFYIRIAGGDENCQGAEERTESVLLQYSVDGGTKWQLLEELHHTDFHKPRFVHIDLPSDTKNPSTRFRWWQPSHSGKGHDQWAVDEIHIGQYDNRRYIEDNFEKYPDPMESGNWMMVTEGVIGKYCQQTNPGLVIGNQPNDKIVITKDLALEPEDVIQFRINVGCGKIFHWNHPVMFQFSHDGGQTWQLVEEPCYQEQDCDGRHIEGSIYYTGTHGEWNLVVIPVTQKIAMHPVIFRWWQPGGMAQSFALDDVYIGPSCPSHCTRHGVCKQRECVCHRGFSGPECLSDEPNPLGMLDRFDNRNQPTAYWQRILGGYLGRGCGVVDHANSLYFNDEGTREAVTDPLDTRNLRMLQFVIKIGSEENHHGCRQPQNRNEGIVVDYSTDNEITWNILKMIEPQLYNGTTQVVVVKLPPEAKSNNTIFRWWQPLGLGGVPRAEWAIDSVLIGANDSNAYGFQDDFSSMMPDPHNWFIADSAVPRLTCNSQGNALEFSTNKGLRYAETWDYHITPSTFLQFDIAMGCGSLYGTLYSVMLEYSVNVGKTWHPVVSECKPPNFECSGYHLSSEYSSDQHMNWTRVTVYLPQGAVSPATRFRWLQHTSHPRGTVWALDNVYLGNGCPWLCSGHGYCKEGQCVCDEGFSEPFCVPTKPLPMGLRDDFNTGEINRDNWHEIYGGENTDTCGNIVSGNALTFHKDQLRMGVTKDIDTSMLSNIEFYFQYGCKDLVSDWPRTHSVLLQYSSNGGITWNLLKELHYRNETGVSYFTVTLPTQARMNATRFRFWQPKNGGEMQTTWAIDNLFVGTMPMNPSSLYENFDSELDPASWLFINNGKLGEYCHFNTRKDTYTAGQSALVFRRTTGGELSVVTRDLDVGPMSVLQFDINVGCGAESTNKYPVYLQFSSNGGKTWQPLVPNCAEQSMARCYDSTLPQTTFFGGTSSYWRRIVVPLDNLHVCGSLRFRWYQGKVPEYDFAPEWAIDNVYVGMSCLDHCNGHGACVSGMMCMCDNGYHGDTCVTNDPHPTYLKEDFSVSNILSVLPSRGDIGRGTVLDPSQQLSKDRWSSWSGGQLSTQCDRLFTGPSLQYGNTGERILVTNELDLTRVSTVQFYLKLGCLPTVEPSSPVFLQYSTNGGIHWSTIEQFDFNEHSNKPQYIALHVPYKARTNSTQLRWWQPSLDGTYSEDWAIDQVYIGGNIYGEEILQDEPQSPKDSTWLMYPGGSVEKVCDSEGEALHFSDQDNMRYAVSADVDVKDETFIQFSLAMGCEQKAEECYDVDLQFSLDMGKTWNLLQPACLPSNVDCSTYFTNSVFQSDIHSGWNRVTVPVPYYARSMATRFRWLQPDDFTSSHTWALSHLYIGSECHSMCSGHGRCFEGSCVCDEGWDGYACQHSITPLPTNLIDDFSDGLKLENWEKVVGGKIDKPCRVLASGDILHFTGGCNRLLSTKDLDLSLAMFIQFYFMFGCNTFPVARDQSVLVDYSSDGGITWIPVTELYYNLYRSPTFISIKIPPGAQKDGVRVRWWQPEHGGRLLGDWAIDNVRINGEEDNPRSLTSNYTIIPDPTSFPTTDNLQRDEYCGADNAVVGKTGSGESSTLTSREVKLEDGYMIQFLINVGCGVPSNVSVPPVNLQYSTDHGMTWSYLNPQCLPSDPQCRSGPQMPTVYYGSPVGEWQRVVVPLEGLPVSNGTRFRWNQKYDGSPVEQTWGIRDVYIGPSCNDFCNGHGYCDFPHCICDESYDGESCSPTLVKDRLTQLKDTFDKPGINKTKWVLVQAGDVKEGCSKLVEGTSLVFDGHGIRQAVSRDLDLRNAKFIQYTAMIGGQSGQPGCYLPSSRDQSVILQFSTDGGITWDTLHTLDYISYLTPKQDYISLPLPARTDSTRVRWWQPVTDEENLERPQWALDNVFIGGTEINPSEFQQSFNDTVPQDDSTAYEFSPYGKIEENVCAEEDGALSWKEGTGTRSFTTNQLIVQTGYMLQFKIVIGCNQHYNVCDDQAPIQLEYNKNPHSERWELVRPLCLPDHSNRMECRPHVHHDASIFALSGYPTWTRVTIDLPEKVYSGSTRFRWIQKSPDKTSPGWALDDIYIGEKCPDMCSGRGDCQYGKCVCDKGYYGPNCQPPRSKLISRMFESFEGGIFNAHWQTVSGGGIGFGCGALLPYAHGKTLYFNGCGVRQAVTAEMDLTSAVKIIFVLQIGCQAQTTDCNVKLGEGPNYRGILLQYSKNKGAEWRLLARHDPEDFMKPERMAYDIPFDIRMPGVQFRWWQPVHDGAGFDQWAVDHIEIVSGRNGYQKTWAKG